MSTDRFQGPVPLGPGITVYAPAVASAEVGGFLVEVTVVPADGRLVAEQVTVRRRPDGPEVSTDALRTIPVAEAVRAVADRSVLMVADSEDAVSASLPDLSADRVAQVREEGPTDENLALVVWLYRVARAMGVPPTQAVSGTLDLPRSTAGRWIARARERGLMGASGGRGRAGG